MEIHYGTDGPPKQSVAEELRDLKQRRDEALERLTKEIPKCDQASLFLLDPQVDPRGQNTFPVAALGSYTEMLKMKTLTDAEDIKEFVGVWTNVLHDTSKEDDPMATDHSPVHGVRFFVGQQLLFETSIDWIANNYWIRGIGFVGFPVKSNATEKLWKVLYQHMPVPKEVLEATNGARFAGTTNAWWQWKAQSRGRKPENIQGEIRDASRHLTIEPGARDE